MKLVSVTVLALVLAFGAAGLGAQEASPLQKLGEEFDAAVRAGDAAKAISFYADDAVMMLDQGPLLEGKQAIQGLLEAMINAKLLPVTRTIIEARTSGDLGFVAGTSTFSMAGGPSIAAKGISVWKRVNGQWKIAYDILNRSGAPPKQ